ncbi:MAG TPA: alpha/beta hydrolase [Sphingomicrobium sp.]|nr:alpha/beta hydrolase [Sphingomicrobium sp.]
MPRSPARATLPKLAAAAFVCVAAFLLVMFEFQAQAIFPTHAVAPPGPLPGGAERVTIAAPGGNRLHGVHIPPAAEPAGGRTLVLGFAGNAWNSEDAATYLHDLYPAADVVAFHYRGYRPSTGSPSSAALLEDAPLVHDFAVAKVRSGRTVAVGFSIGSGVAAHLARERPLDGLVLVTPFDSLKAVAAGHYPYLPVGALFRHDMDAAAALKGSRVPTAIIAAERDTIIPPPRTEALRPAIGNLLFDRTIAGAGHNDLYQRPEFRAAMKEALQALGKPGARPGA